MRRDPEWVRGGEESLLTSRRAHRNSWVFMLSDGGRSCEKEDEPLQTKKGRNNGD